MFTNMCIVKVVQARCSHLESFKACDHNSPSLKRSVNGHLDRQHRFTGSVRHVAKHKNDGYKD